MKKQLLLTLSLFITCCVFAQSGRRFNLVQQADFSQANAQLSGMAARAAKDIDCCWELLDSCRCSDLKDPWENDSVRAYSQQVDIANTSRKSANVQKSMAGFEKALLQGKGGRRLTADDVKNAFTRYPGYRFSAISNRFDIYMQKLKAGK